MQGSVEKALAKLVKSGQKIKVAYEVRAWGTGEIEGKGGPRGAAISNRQDGANSTQSHPALPTHPPREQTDPTLLGGFQVEIGDKFVDLSVRSKVQHYTNLISQSL